MHTAGNTWNLNEDFVATTDRMGGHHTKAVLSGEKDVLLMIFMM
jgi:hypothetical protein